MTEEAKEEDEEVEEMMETEVVMGATGEETAIIKTTIEEAKGTIMTEVVTEIDKGGMRIVIIGDIMTNAVEVTTTTMIGGVEVGEEITIEGTDNMTTVDMEEVVATEAEEDIEVEINQEAMQISV